MSTKSEAEDADWKFKGDIEALNRRYRLTGRTQAPTVNEFWDRVIEYAVAREFDPSTVKNKHRAWKRFGPLVADHRMDELNEAILDPVRVHVKASCRSITTARITIDEIRAMLHLAKRWHVIAVVPDLPRITDAEMREAGYNVDDAAAALDADELRALFAELRSSRSPRNFTIATVQFWAARRVGEVMGLQISKVEPGQLSFEVQWDDEEQALGPCKDRKIHRTPGTEPMFEVLERYAPELPESGFVFARADTGRPPRRASYNGALRRAAIRAGIRQPERVSSHILRHTAATFVGDETGSELAVQHLLGHSTPVHTRRYMHGQARAVKKAVSALETAMNRKPNRKPKP
ncbi:MAG: site-specific integrase [Nannocystaceae bacterium]|nr:site-specific integrase [Nannocystaceae bacterium]